MPPTRADSARPRPGGTSLPWRSWKLWLLVFAAVTAIGLLEAMQAYVGEALRGKPIDWSRAAGATMPSWYVLALLLPGIYVLARNFRFDDGRGRALAVHLPAAGVFAVLHLGLSSVVSEYVMYRELLPAFSAFGSNLFRLVSVYFVVEMSFYLGLVGAYHAYDYYQRYREREQRAAQLELETSRLEASLARANLAALKMQLHPHFLFNTLNAISVLSMKGEKTAVVRMLNRLSELLRISLENGAQLVPLREELDFLERYLDIEQVRFRDRLTVHTEIADEVLEAEVPSLLMQPLVENAIRHGIAQRPGPGRIEIRAAMRGGFLALEVRDTGPGFKEADGPDRQGVGLANTRARLEQLYGDHHRFETRNASEGGAIVAIAIPYRRYRGDAQAEAPAAVEPEAVPAGGAADPLAWSA